MSQSLSERLRSLTPGVKIYNASDRPQKLSFNSQAYVFPPGESVDIHGQDMTPQDNFGRTVQEDLERSIPNPNATADIVATYLLTEGRNLGLVLLRGDASDPGEIADGTKRFVVANTGEAKRIEARWLQKVLEARSAGQGAPPMPLYVEEAQDFLTKYKNGISETHKRFVVTVDGRSFNTRKEAKSHIIARYPTKSAEWMSLVNDTVGIDEDPEDDQEAVAMIAAKESRKKKPEVTA